MLSSPFGKARRKMERQYCAFFVIFFLIHLAQAQDQKGFINLDCGLSPNDPPYADYESGLTYISDAGYVRGGKIGKAEKGHKLSIFQSTLRLRYFPDGTRNCYNLNVTQGSKYLIRAVFVYGNYDGLNAIPNFDLYLGATKWATINAILRIEEIIHVARSNSLQVCLVKTGISTPMISSLELRPLKNTMYATESGSFRNVWRNYFEPGAFILRYPDDIHDRLWINGYDDEDQWRQINTTLSINTSTGYDIPQSVMANAITPQKGNTTLNISWSLEDPNLEIYLYMHFAELQTQAGGDERDFFIFFNDELINGPYTPKLLTVQTIYDTKPRKCKEGKCLLRLEGIGSLPPMLNAVEAYTVVNHLQLETNEDDVAAITDIHFSYNVSRISWEGDPCVPSKFIWDGLKCNSLDNTKPPVITFLNLSSSALTGIISPSILKLSHLQELDLSNNSLTGSVPEFLADMKSLLVINLSGNNLNGPVPKKLIEKKGLKLNVEGNPKIICKTGSCVNGGNGESKNKMIIPIVASIAAVVILIVALIIYCVLKKKKKPSNDEVLGPTSVKLPIDDRSSDRSSEVQIMTKNKRFTYSEVTTMTNDFQRVLGKGGFGIVYYGCVNGSEEVAVKMLSQSSSQGYKQFKAEVELLLVVHHKNLVGLVGYCDEGDKLALIYEYMANGDLDEHMSGKRGGSYLNWATRLKIVAESAQGLEYLHNGCTPPMVHRDIKTTNILLNKDFHAKLADFGLSRSFPMEGETHVSTVVAGTIGYLDPEYYRTNWLTEKSDVYSFGIVILVIITNQPVIDQNREKRHIAEWVGKMLSKGDINSIMDPSLHGDYDSGSVWKAVEIAMLCLNPSSVNRPTMTQVVLELNECLALENSRGGESREMESQGSIEVSIAANPTAR